MQTGGSTTSMSDNIATKGEDLTRQDGKSVTEALSHVCLSNILSDVEFVFPNEENAPAVLAHKLVLSIRSPVFRAMFYGQMEQKGPIEIADSDRETFVELMRFIYTDQICFGDTSQLVSLLHAAEKYQITKLTETCQIALLRIMDKDNVCYIFSHSTFLGIKPLQHQALEFVVENSEEVLKSKGWNDLRIEDIGIVLDSLDITASEVTVFQAAVHWASTTCERKELPDTPENQRNVLDEALYKNRFVDMSPKEFSKTVCCTGVLTCEEQLGFLKFMVTGTDPLPVKFKSDKRKREDFVINIDGPLSRSVPYLENAEVCITFSTPQKQMESMVVTKVTIVTPREFLSGCFECKRKDKQFIVSVSQDIFLKVQ